MKIEQCRDRLIELLRAHNLGIESANAYLVSIKTAIAENRLEALQQSLSGPEMPMAEIERLESERHSLLQAYGFDGDDDGFQKCVDWCDDDGGHVNELYQQLVQNLVELQRSIQLNSLLVSKGQERVRRSIGILTGIGNADQANTYRSDGRTAAGNDRRDIAIA